MRVGVPGVGWSERTGWASSRAGELAGGVFAVHGTEGVEEGGGSHVANRDSWLETRGCCEWLK